MMMFMLAVIGVTCQIVSILAEAKMDARKTRRRPKTRRTFNTKEEFMEEMNKELQDMVGRIYEELGIERKPEPVKKVMPIEDHHEEDFTLTVWNRKILDPTGRELRTVGEVFRVVS